MPAPTAQVQSQGKKGCGGLGQILMVIVAAGTAGLGASIAGGAAAGAAASVASQGVGMLTGVQDRFSWKGVALAAISGGVGSGLQAVAAGFSAGNALTTGAVMGVGRNVISQGVSVALGLQPRFDWTAVALAGITDGVGARTSGWLADKGTWNGVSLAQGGLANYAVTGAASAIAGAASQSLMTGSSFGDNLLDRLPDVIGSTIGNAVGARINERIEQARQAAQRTQYVSHAIEALSKREAFRDASTEDLRGAAAYLADSDEWSNARYGRHLSALTDEGAMDLARMQRLQRTPDIGSFDRLSAAANVFRSVNGLSEGQVGEILQMWSNSGVVEDPFVLRLNGGRYEVTSVTDEGGDYGLGPDGTDRVSDILVTGRRLGTVFRSVLADDGVQSVGVVTGQIGREIESRPWLGLGITALEIAAGPVRFAVSEGIARSPIGQLAESALGRVHSYFGGEFEKVQYGAEASNNGATGTMVLGGLILGMSAKRLLGMMPRAAETAGVRGLSAVEGVGSNSGLYRVGPSNEIRGTVPGLDAHHVGQKALLGDMIPGYDPLTAPAILVPKVGHTIRGPNGIVSRSVEGLTTPRSVVARDILELRRVYPDIPNSQLQELVRANKTQYPQSFVRGN